MPMIDAQRTAARYAALQVELPPEAQAAFDVYQAAVAAANGKDTAFGDDLNAGKLSPRNIADRMLKDATREAARQHMQRVMVPDIDRACAARAHRAFISDIPRVFNEVRPRFERTAGIVVEALDVIDAASFADPVKLFERGPDATNAFHTLSDALPTLDGIRDVLTDLAARHTPVQSVSLFVTVQDNEAVAATFEAAVDAWSEKKTQWLSLFALEGVTPKLNDVDQADELIRRARSHEPKATVTA